MRSAGGVEQNAPARRSQKPRGVRHQMPQFRAAPPQLPFCVQEQTLVIVREPHTQLQTYFPKF